MPLRANLRHFAGIFGGRRGSTAARTVRSWHACEPESHTETLQIKPLTWGGASALQTGSRMGGRASALHCSRPEGLPERTVCRAEPLPHISGPTCRADALPHISGADCRAEALPHISTGQGSRRTILQNLDDA